MIRVNDVIWGNVVLYRENKSGSCNDNGDVKT